MKKMACRVAGLPSPGVDPLFELERILSDCRSGMSSVAAGVAEGRLSEESMLRLMSSLNDRARAACESMRSCKNEIESVLPRNKPVWTPAKAESAPR